MSYIYLSDIHLELSIVSIISGNGLALNNDNPFLELLLIFTNHANICLNGVNCDSWYKMVITLFHHIHMTQWIIHDHHTNHACLEALTNSRKWEKPFQAKKKNHFSYAWSYRATPNSWFYQWIRVWMCIHMMNNL